MKRKWIMVLGIIVILIPAMGLPSLWKNSLFVISGLLVFVLAYLNHDKKTDDNKEILEEKVVKEELNSGEEE